MVWHPTKDACKRLWGRRWVRRITYLIAAGVGTTWGGAWLLERPAVTQWAVGKADAKLRELTGLSLSLDRLEIHPFFGLLRLDGIAIGGDLLTIRSVELRLEPRSLFIGTPRIYTLRITEPHVRLSPDRIARIHLKPRPDTDTTTPQVLIDLLSVNAAKVEVLEPVWGLPKGEVDFDIKGRGEGSNQIRVSLVAPKLSAQGPRGLESGKLDLDADLSERWIVLQNLKAQLGESRLTASGAFQPRAEHHLELKTEAMADLAQVFAWAGTRGAPPMGGELRAKTQVTGTLTQPTWTIQASGQGLKPGDARFAAGDLDLQAKGALKEADLESLRWSSSQGKVDATGHWAEGKPITAHLQLSGASLEPVAQVARVDLLSGVKLDLAADLRLPSDPKLMASPARWEATAKAMLTQDGEPAGGFTASLKDGQAALPDLALHLRGLEASGKGAARLDAKGLSAFNADGNAALDAGAVASALKAWKIVDLDMGGATNAQATVAWTSRQGLTLDGDVDVLNPRWHGATADHLKGHAAIRGEDLSIDGIHIDKAKGFGDGQLKLTWANHPVGEPFDLHFSFQDLPVEEGLKAADLQLPITGLGFGEARLHGPYDHLLLEGNARLADGLVYGITIPAASTGFDLSIDKLILHATDLRVADSADHLGGDAGKPSGTLALTGGGRMDLNALTADLRISGALDTQILKLPVPPIQAAVDLHLNGPLASKFGSQELPEGTLQVRNGSISFENQSLIGLEADLSRQGPKLNAKAGFAGHKEHAITVDLGDRGGSLFGQTAIHLAPDTAPTQALASQFSGGVLQDLLLDLNANGSIGPQGLRWQGRLDQFRGDFGAFDLTQSRPTELRGTDKSATLSLELEGRQKGETGPPTGRVSLAGTLPFSTHEPMDLQSTGAMDLANLKVILDTLLDVDPYGGLGDLKPTGHAEYTLRAYGTYADPEADGRMSLANGTLRYGDYPSLEHLAFTIIAKGHELTFPKESPLQGSLAQGSLSVDGKATWGLGGITKYDLNGSLKGFQLRDLPDLDGVDAGGSLAVTLKGDDTGGTLKGRIDADRVSYEADINLSDLILKSALSESGLNLLNPNDPLDRIALDLDLHLNQPWNCDTNLLKLEGRPEGPFKILGTLANPGIKGRMSFLPGGRVTNLLPAGDVVIDRGYLNFTDPTSTDPYINLHGTVQLPGYQVDLDVHGTLSNLDIVPTSTPSLRRDEIVAILVQPDLASTIATSTPGTSQNAVSSGLASASSGLVSTLFLAALQERLRRTFGLDRVSVTFRTGTASSTTGSGNFERDIQLGKTFTLFDRRIPILAFQNKSGELTTTGATVEIRFGGVVLNLGVSQTAGEGVDPTGLIMHTWSPR